jgi:trans-2,3-dihydro-3-hydroxyanthranilate isomerase
MSSRYRKDVTNMGGLDFCLVDVFAEEKYAGNQLAVVKNASSLSTSQMQRIANEMHFSETTFILSGKQPDGGYDVRIFTPEKELQFAGHPTLGTAYVIKHSKPNDTSDQVLLNLKLGQIPVTFEKDEQNQELLWMKQIHPIFGKTFDVEIISKILSLGREDVDPRYPIQEVSTGLPFIIVPLRNLAAVKRAYVTRQGGAELLKETKAGLLIYCAETYHPHNDLNVRVFVDAVGIPEDPATGSGNGCLAGYLSKYKYLGNEIINARVEQGYEINRPSLLLLKTRKEKQGISIHVGGKVVMIASGTLL